MEHADKITKPPINDDPDITYPGEKPPLYKILFFDGVTFNVRLDGKVLTSQFHYVNNYMWTSINEWCFLGEMLEGYMVSKGKRACEQSISARVRDMRKRRFGRCLVERKRTGPNLRLHAYRVTGEHGSTVINANYGADFDVYIGSRSIWANPYWWKPGAGTDPQYQVEDRAESITKFRSWITKRPDLMARLHELRGKVLGCSCYPKGCHGDVLSELADYGECTCQECVERRKNW